MIFASSPALAIDSNMAKEVLAEINLARTKPAVYATYIKEFRKQFNGRLYIQPGKDVMVQTTEGVVAVDEAITFLSRQKPLAPLLWSKGLADAASGHAEEQDRSGNTGHVSNDGTDTRERIERHGKWERAMAENISYGPTDARGVVIQLIVDDGVKSRGHRKNIFNPGLGVAGVGCNSHPKYGSVCVIDFAGGFKQ
jgi:uncharacterized protein YkwD